MGRPVSAIRYPPYVVAGPVVGLRYELHLDFPDLESVYRGRVRVTGLPPTPEVTFDLEALTVLSVAADGRGLPFTVENDPGRLIVRDAPATGLTIDFESTVDREAPIGIYQSPLGDGVAVTTHLEPARARRVFPCFDRPDAKAVFELEVVAPDEFTVISNAPARTKDRAPDGRGWTRFDPTPPMSTYLFYLGIGPFEQAEREIEGIRTICATARGAAARTGFVADAAARAIRFFGDYYGIPYPLPKMHLVGMPKFLSGAMENWGAIVFAEPFVLVDENTSVMTRMVVVNIAAHEVAHQWFGNLVTMRTWDDLWLNESFATFAGYKARDALHPDWDSWSEFCYYETGTGLMVDSLPGTHPIQVSVTDPARAAEFFDDVSYAKGSSVLRMLEGFVGEAAFRDGVALYLREHAWGNAEATDLWGAVARTSRQPVDRVMPEWILRPGYPVVTVEQRDLSLVLSQRRFSLVGSPNDPPWPIPLTVQVDGTRVERLMHEPTAEIPISRDADVLVAPGRTGFFRVRYKGPVRQRILARYRALAPLDRLGLQDDGLAFLLAGEMDFPEYLDLLRRGETETNPSLVSQAYDALTWVRPLVYRIPAWEEAFRRVFTSQGERLGPAASPGESPATTTARDMVTRARVALDPLYRLEMRHRFEAIGSAAPEVRQAIYMAYAATASGVEYSGLIRQMREAPPGHEGRMIATGLGMLSRTEWLLECLNRLGSGEMQVSSWIALAYAATWLNPTSGDALWAFLSGNLESRVSSLATGGGTMALVLQYSLPVAGLDRPAEIRQWVADHPIREGEEGAKKGLGMLAAFENVLDAARRAGLEVTRRAPSS